MKLGARDHISYLDDEGTVSRYQLVLDGKPVMLVLANRIDPTQTIHIRRVDSDQTHPTTGKFALKTEVIEDVDSQMIGMAPTRPSAMSIYQYVVPRMHRFIARLYVPAQETPST